MIRDLDRTEQNENLLENLCFCRQRFQVENFDPCPDFSTKVRKFLYGQIFTSARKVKGKNSKKLGTIKTIL